MWRKILAAVILIIIGDFFSCSSGVKLQFQQPGQDHLIGIKRLVIAPCDGADEAGLLCNFLTTLIKQTDYFELFDSNKFSAALEQEQLSYEKIKQAGLNSQVGKLLNVNGVIFSELKSLEISADEQGVEKVEKNVWTGEYERDANGTIIEELSPTGEKTKKKKYKHQLVDQHYRFRKAKIEASFQLVNLQQGSSIVTRELTENYVSDKIIREENQKAPSDDEIKNTIALNIVQKFFDEIAPKAITVKRVIEMGTALIDSGAIYAKTGQWNRAREYWDQAQKVYPADARVLYNMGLAFEAQGDYKSAVIYYKKASLLNPKKKLYQQAVQNLGNMWQKK